MPHRTRLAVLACAAGAALVAVPASAQDMYSDSVDLQVVSGATVKGTIRGAQERENLVLDLPQGAVVVAAAKRRGKGAFVPLLDLVDSVPSILAAGVPRGSGSKLTGPAAVADGIHRLRVFGDGQTDGDYRLTVKIRPQAKWHGSGTTVPLAAQTTFGFAAPSGARAKIALRPARGSGFVPALDTVTDPDGALLHTLSGRTTGFLPLAGTGTYTVAFDDGGAAGGEWICDVTLRLPRARAAKIDISAAALTGPFVDDQPVYGRLAGDGADLLVDPPDDGGPLDGVSISLQPGSLPFPAVLTMGEVATFDLPEGQGATGPAIGFGPRGTTFGAAKPATLTLTFDESLFTDPANELTVWVLDEATGERTAVPKPYEFPAPGLVRFPTSHFSAYVPARDGASSPVGDWAFLEVRAQQESDWGGQVSMTAGTLTFESDHTFRLNADGAKSRWIRAFDDGQTIGPRVESFPDYSYDNGTWSEPGSLSIEVLTSGEETVLLSRSRHGHFIVAPTPSGGTEADIAWLLRRARGLPTLSNIAGRWHIVALRAGAREIQDTTTRRVRLELEAVRGTATFAADGSATYRATSLRSAGTEYPSGSWTSESGPATGTGRVEVFGSQVAIYMDDDEPTPAKGGPRGGSATSPVARLTPCLGGDVLAGVSDAYQSDGSEPTIWFLLREGSGLRPSALTGVTSATGIGFETADRPGGVQGLRVVASEAVVEHSSAKSGSVDPAQVVVFDHDASGEPMSYFPGENGTDFTYALSGSGVYSTNIGVSGAISRDGRLFAGIRFVGGRYEFFLGVPGENFSPQR